jgi:hypothetical protein
MNKKRNWIVGLMLVSLLTIGVVALAGNGFGGSKATSNSPQTAAVQCALYERDTDGDGILNCDDPDWVTPADGSGYGAANGYGQNLSGTRPLDGSGFGGHLGSRNGAGQGSGNGVRDGSCV